MENKTMENLLVLGFDKEWLKMVATKFATKKKGRFGIKIFDIEDLSMEPDDGIFIDETCFDTERELSLIHFFYEGFGYVMTDNETNKEIGRGIIDGAPFDEIEDVIGERWDWLNPKELGPWYNNQRKQELAKLTQSSQANFKEV